MANIKQDVDILQVFSLVEILSGISDHEGLQGFANHCEVIIKKPGSVLVKEGDRGNEAFVVVNGEIEILRRNLSGNEDILVARFGVDNKAKKLPLIGEQSLISHDGIRLATVKAITEVTLLRVRYEAFEMLIKQHPDIGMHIYKEICMILVERLSGSNKNVAALFHAYKETLEEEDLLDE